ncbi:MAG: exo-alpha-sialidase [Pseudomonadota bacterium]
MLRVLLPALCCTCALAQTPAPPTGPLLGQDPPGNVPELFAPGLISTEGARELNAVFSPDMRIFMFTREIDGVFKMHFSFRNAQDEWTAPKLVAPSLTYPGHADVDMSFAPGGQRLYFISKRPLPGHALETYNIWYSDRSPEGLLPPVALGPHINGAPHELYPWAVGDGSLYFTTERADSLGERDSYRARFRGGRFDAPVNLGPAINSEFSEGDIFVDADETLLIHFSRGRPDDLGKGDLYVSFRDDDGDWAQDRHLGDVINSPDIDYCPVVTPDGRYFFFTRGDDIYWVDAAVLEPFRP